MKDTVRERLIDGHLHLSRTAVTSRYENVAELRSILDEAHLRAVCVQNIVLWEERHLVRNVLSLLLKLLEPERIFSFGGLRLPKPEAQDKYADYAAQARELMALGFDGIKLFWKPNVRRAFGEPLDSPVFDELYAYLEAEQIPIMFHMGDPRAFWDEALAPAFAKQNGWLYTAPNDVPFATLYAETERLLARFPQLRVTFAHLYFLGDDLPALRAFLTRHLATRLDITPGAELYSQLSACPEEARAFFLEFQDRIQFGTDNVGTAGEETFSPSGEAISRIDTIWRFLSEDRSEGWGQRLGGLSLPAPVLRKLAYQNFYDFIRQDTPRPVDALRAAHFAHTQRQLAAAAKDVKLDAQLMRACAAIDTFC